MLAQLLLGLTLSAVGLSLSGKLEPVLLFAYFRTPEEALHLAWSEDARTWHPLNQNRPVYRTPFEGSCLRDPFLVRGPEGFFTCSTPAAGQGSSAPMRARRTWCTGSKRRSCP